MNKNYSIIFGIIVIAIIGFFVFYNTPTEKNKISVDTAAISEQPKEDTAQMDLNTKMGSYEPYLIEKIAMAETNKVVLFFHASWCPTCKALNGDIEKNKSAIPEGVTILKADYDKETELKKKYGVTTQHTLVQVNKDGELIKKWSGGLKLENLLSQIQ